jgi:hypothetical protein
VISSDAQTAIRQVSPHRFAETPSYSCPAFRFPSRHGSITSSTCTAGLFLAAAIDRTLRVWRQHHVIRTDRDPLWCRACLSRGSAAGIQPPAPHAVVRCSSRDSRQGERRIRFALAAQQKANSQAKICEIEGLAKSARQSGSTRIDGQYQHLPMAHRRLAPPECGIHAVDLPRLRRRRLFPRYCSSGHLQARVEAACNLNPRERPRLHDWLRMFAILIRSLKP